VELRVRGLSAEELQKIDAVAAAHGMGRTEYVKFVLLAADQPPMSDAELHLLLAQKARAGNMRALELLSRSMSLSSNTPVRPDQQDKPFAEVIALAKKRDG
jgi:hypothetical protein